MINKKSKIFVAGHKGMVGSAILRKLEEKGYKNIITVDKKKLDLTNQKKVNDFFKKKKPDFVFMAAAKVGGIYSNNTYKAEFINVNLSIQTNVIDSAYKAGVKNLIFLGSSCVYPRNCKQPIKESYLLNGKLEETNDAYAIAKIAGIKMCESYNEQYKTNYKCLMPTNAYGPNDNYHELNSHFIPALIKKAYNINVNKKKQLILWGDGSAIREVIYVDDIADACVFFMNKKTKHSLINVGTGVGYSIKEYAKKILKLINPGRNIKIIFDKTKPNGTPKKVLDVKLAEKYGWKAKSKLDISILKTYKSFLKEKMVIKNLKDNKFEYLIIFCAFLISILWAVYNLNKFDQHKVNFDGNYYNPLLYADLNSTWSTAEKIRNNLKKKQSFINSIPEYDRFFLPSILIGYYYHILDKDIYEKKGDNDFVIKKDNFKFGFLFLQITFYFITIFFFSKELKKKIPKINHKIIIIFLSLEPSLLQWHSSFWSESIFLSFMIILFTLLIGCSKKIYPNFFIGILIGFLFLQRSVSILYIFPVIIFIILTHKEWLKYTMSIFLGCIIILVSVCINNFKKTGAFYITPTFMSYYSYYHYFAHIIKSDRENISAEQAKKELLKNEEIWIKANNIDLNEKKDLLKNINYRNKIFLNEALTNPLFTIKFFIKRTIKMSIIMPNWVNKHFYYDRTDPEAKNDPKKYYNKGILYNVLYSSVLYFFICVGLFIFIKKILNLKKRKLIDNLISILYFISISGLWGNPKYFVPCILSLSFFFSDGFVLILNKYLKKNF